MAFKSHLRICLGIALSLFGTHRNALANVGPPSSGGYIIGEPVGIKDVAITRETLTIDLRPLAANGLTRVEAVYHLHNRGEEKRLDLVFAGGAAGMAEFQVWLDEVSIPSNPAARFLIRRSSSAV